MTCSELFVLCVAFLNECVATQSPAGPWPFQPRDVSPQQQSRGFRCGTTCTRTYRHVRTRTHARTCTGTQERVRAQALKNGCARAHPCLRACTCACLHMCVPVHVRSRVRARTHLCVRLLSLHVCVCASAHVCACGSLVPLGETDIHELWSPGEARRVVP